MRPRSISAIYAARNQSLTLSLIQMPAGERRAGGRQSRHKNNTTGKFLGSAVRAGGRAIGGRTGDAAAATAALAGARRLIGDRRSARRTRCSGPPTLELHASSCFSTSARSTMDCAMRTAAAMGSYRSDAVDAGRRAGTISACGSSGADGSSSSAPMPRTSSLAMHCGGPPSGSVRGLSRRRCSRIPAARAGRRAELSRFQRQLPVFTQGAPAYVDRRRGRERIFASYLPYRTGGETGRSEVVVTSWDGAHNGQWFSCRADS